MYSAASGGRLLLVLLGERLLVAAQQRRASRARARLAVKPWRATRVDLGRPARRAPRSMRVGLGDRRSASPLPSSARRCRGRRRRRRTAGPASGSARRAGRSACRRRGARRCCSPVRRRRSPAREAAACCRRDDRGVGASGSVAMANERARRGRAPSKAGRGRARDRAPGSRRSRSLISRSIAAGSKSPTATTAIRSGRYQSR